MKAMKNVRSARTFIWCLRYITKIYSVREISIGEEKYHNKQFDLFYLVFNSYASALIK